jgi:hypothetical protein
MENFIDENEHSSQNVEGAGAGYGLRPDGTFREAIHGVEVSKNSLLDANVEAN